MDRTGSLTRQHESIIELIESISDELKEDKLTDKEVAKNIRRNLSFLSGKLRVHMNREDKFLYPELLDSNDQEVKNIARQYIDEMGDMAEVFQEFSKKYSRYSLIIESPAEFRKEAETLFNKLEQRIERENEELYQLV